MRPLRTMFLALAGGICAALALAGCASTAQHKWLSFFFDGVPGSAPVVTNGPAATGSNAIHRAGGPAPSHAGPAQPVMVVHKPYFEDKCLNCHESQYSVVMRAPVKEVCFSCHKDFVAKTAPKSTHQPFDNGECMSCHNPHYTTNKFLLVKTGKALCADCHDPFVAKPVSIHEPYENGECLSCHDPHQSGFKKLVTKTDKALCFDCHDDFLAKAKFKHDPADNGDCVSCHNPHETGNKSLLAKDGQKICFDCHEEKDMAAATGHANIGKALCLDCHDPHIGTDKYLLKAVRTAAKPPAP